MFESDEVDHGSFFQIFAAKICPSSLGGQPISLSRCRTRFQNQVHGKKKLLPGELASSIHLPGFSDAGRFLHLAMFDVFDRTRRVFRRGVEIREL